VREGTGGVKPLSEKDRAEIERLINDKILSSRQHPAITFASTAVSAEEIRGELTVLDVGRPVRLQVTGSGPTAFVARGRISQSDYGIKALHRVLRCAEIGRRRRGRGRGDPAGSSGLTGPAIAAGKGDDHDGRDRAEGRVGSDVATVPSAAKHGDRGKPCPGHDPPPVSC
jgi:hypothetical protein